MSEWQQQDNQMAQISAIAGIGSWIVFPVLGAIIAIVCGHIARKEIRESGGTQGGDGMAVLGLALGYSHLVMSCLVLGFVLLIFAGAFTAIGLSAAQAQ